LKIPDIPQDEPCRLETLRSLDILDTSPEERFDRLTRMAKRMFGVPIALVSLVDENRQWFKSCIGPGVGETSRDVSFCGHAILGEDVFIIPNAKEDERFADNPLVLGEPHVVFYAGRPLRAWNGQKLGTLCIIDQKPRNLDHEELEAFNDLASMAKRELAAIQLVAPIRRLIGGTRAVEQGDLAVEIHFKTSDELASLAESFNRMVAGLTEKEHIKETFGKYVDPRIVRDLLENRIPAEGGERRVMTVFFSDLADFPQMCEGLMPDITVRFLNRYFSLMSAVIGERQGIIDKFIGDSVMAFWGPPFTSETEHAELCCRAALDQMARLDNFRAALWDLLGVRQGLPNVSARMGIATGEVTVGNIGSETVRGYTVIGNTVNLASRLEQANKFYGTRILATEETRRGVTNELAFREIDSLRLAGKSMPVRVFELLGYERNLSDAQGKLIVEFERGLAAYRKCDWDAAQARFHDCLKTMPADGPSQVLLEGIEEFSRVPPAAGWDGAWIAESK
jgi:class 3 adenylate cyclase